MIEVTILKLADLGSFWVRQKPGQRSSAEVAEFQRMEARMSAIFDSDEGTGVPLRTNAHRDMECVGREKIGKRWYRVRIKSVMETTRQGLKASVFLLDYAEECSMPVQFLRELPGMFHPNIIPYQAKQCKLFALQPITLQVSYTDITTSYQPRAHYDVAALEHVKQICQDSSEARIEIMSTDDNGLHHVKLFFKVGRTLICINDDMMEHTWAVLDNTDTDDMHNNRKSSSALSHPTQRSTSPQDYNMHGEPASTRMTLTECYNRDKQRELLAKSQRSQYMSSDDGEGIEGHTSPRHHVLTQDRSQENLPYTCTSVQEHNYKLIANPKNVHIDFSKIVCPEGGASSITHNSYSDQRLSSNDHNYLSNPRQSDPMNRYSASNQNSSLETTIQESIPRLEMTGDLNNRGRHSTDMFDDPNSRGAHGLDMYHNSSSRQSPTINDFPQSNRISPDISPQLRGRMPKIASTSPTRTPLASRSTVESDNEMNATSRTVSRSKVAFNQNNCVKEFSSTQYGERSILSSPNSSPESARKERIKSILKTPPSNQSREYEENGNVESLDASYNVRSGIHGQFRSSLYGVRESHCDDTVLVDGDMKPAPFVWIEDATFSESVKKTLLQYDYSAPKIIQRHVWPAALRGRHLAAISPRSSGKTASYLCPLLTQIETPDMYSELGEGNGPYALILSPSWKKAQFIYDVIRRFQAQNKQLRALVLFGGGSETNQVVPLLNGCEVMVATPHCFSRMLRGEYTNLKRLCHLVLDDADYLTEHYIEPLKEIMKAYNRELSDNLDRSAPNQIMIFSQRWTPGIESFFNKYLIDPLVIISCLTEASIYAKVNQRVEMCKSAMKMAKLIGLLDLSVNMGEKTVICTSSISNAKVIFEALAEHYRMLAHEEMLDMYLEEVKRDWCLDHQDDSKPILVITDACLDRGLLKVTDATEVIHFDLTSSKKEFSLRMSLMLDNFINKRVTCKSHIFVCESDVRRARHVLELLQRCKCDIPQHLVDFAKGHQISKEEIKSENIPSLCHYMKAYGECREKAKCNSRHLISRSWDLPGECPQRGLNYLSLPTSGEVKVKVTHIQDATCLYVHLLEHRAPDGSTNKFSNDYITVVLNMSLYFSSSANRKRIGSPKLQHVYGYLDKDRNNTYHRVLVLQQHTGDKHSEVLVRYVDEGITQWVPTSGLYVLSSELKDVPFQAVEVFACRIQPVDSDQDWTDRASDFVHHLTFKEEIEGAIVLSLGNTLWLDPIVKREKLPCIRVVSNVWNLRRILLSNDFAVQNKQHLERLYNECQGRLDLPVLKQMLGKENVQQESLQMPIEVETFPESEEYHELYCSAMERPDLFFVHRRSTNNQLEDIMDQLNSDTSLFETNRLSEDLVELGNIVLCKFSEDKRWYRGEVLASNGSGGYNVFFVDYGEREWHSVDDMCPLPQDKLYTEFPFQAIECSLANIAPAVGQGWPDSSVGALEKLMYTDTDDKRLLVAKVISKMPASYSHSDRYLLEVYDTSSDSTRDINLAQELISKGHATSTDERVKKMVRGRYPHDKIPHLCATLYRTKAVPERLALAKEIQSIINQSSNFRDEIRENGGLRSLCHLLKHSYNSDIQDHLMVGLVFLTLNNSRNLEEMRKEEAFDTMCELLEKSNNRVKENIAWVFKNLPLTENVRIFIGDAKGTKSLCDILFESSCAKLYAVVMGALANLCTDCNRNCSVVVDTDCIHRLCVLLKESSDSSIVLPAVTILAILSSYQEYQQDILRESPIPIILKHLKQTSDENVVQQAARVFKRVASHNPDFRSQLNVGGVELALQRLLSAVGLVVSKEIKKLCESVIQMITTQQHKLKQLRHGAKKHKSCAELIKLNSKILAEPIIDLPHLEADESLAIRRTPQVKWCEDLFSVLLSVQVTGVQNVDRRFTESTIHFSTMIEQRKEHEESEFIIYAFDLDLHAPINCSKTRIEICELEVLIKMKKMKRGRWRKLTDVKVPWLSVDFNRYQDSSSDEQSDSEGRLMMLQRISHKRNGFGKVPAALLQKKEYYYDSDHSDTSSKDDSDEPTEHDRYDFFREIY